MNTVHPDVIIVVDPDGDYSILVEVEPKENFRQNTIEQLKSLMVSMSCSIGLAVTGKRIALLRDSFEESQGESITVVKDAKLPEYLLPPVDEFWLGNNEFEFALRVQLWLGTLKHSSSLETWPEDLQELFSEPIISLLRLGDIRAARPRWSRVAG